MAEWTTRIIYQFFVELGPIDNGGVWTRWTNLVQCYDGSQGRQECNIQERIGTTPWMLMHGSKRSEFRAFGCRAYVYLNEERRET
jgi:hypothetical protein